MEQQGQHQQSGYYNTTTTTSNTMANTGVTSTNTGTERRSLHYDEEQANGLKGANGAEAADEKPLDEYSGLVRFISTYRDPRRKSVAVPYDQQGKSGGAKWYMPWKKAASTTVGDDWETPDDWLETDMSHGLTNAEVERRRKTLGFNELTTEKTNLFIQFLSYFTGPILYGKFA